ncbi:MULTISPECIES: TIGR02186 family protein [unclassified Yoonia]|uniref:TIGR02186 family protein n=1 Tax=unclassified Yoonia TaxID=2629118 RepID=UPI002AFE48EE|nr:MULTISPECIES: TIGR02186 family protein [unclassified Yoonia]
MIRLFAILMLLALPAKAEEIVLGLSRDEVAITVTFEGSEIIVFGAVSRTAPPPQDSTLGVIVTIAGPSEPVTVRRKARQMGIWVNTDAVFVNSAPSFYAVATSAPINEILREVEDLRHRITIPRAIRSAGAVVEDSVAFTEALIRVKTDQDLYQMREGAVTLDQDTLFRSAISMPANLTEGNYDVRIYLTRNGSVIDSCTTTIPVNKVGLERWLYNLAHEQAFIYGLLSLAIAIGAGWLASAVFTLLRR